MELCIVLHHAIRWDRVAASVPPCFLQRQLSIEATTLALQLYKSRVAGIQVGAGRAGDPGGSWEGPKITSVPVARIQAVGSTSANSLLWDGRIHLSLRQRRGTPQSTSRSPSVSVEGLGFSNLLAPQQITVCLCGCRLDHE